MSKIDRRQLLAAAPAAGFAALVVGAGPVEAACAMPVETPVGALFREWQEASRIEDVAYAADEWGDGDEAKAASASRNGVEQRMIEEPAVNERDVLLKILAVTVFGQFGPNQERQHDLWAEARALVGA